MEQPLYCAISQENRSSIINLGHVLTGFSVCWTAPILPKLQNRESTPLLHLITDKEAAWVASILNFGTITGAQLSGYSANRLGRKMTLILFSSVLLIGNTVLLAANSIHMVYAGRIVLGIGIGGVMVTNIVYIGEIASPNIRGIILTSTGIMHNCGGLLVFAVAPFVSYSMVGYITVCISTLHVLGGFCIMESPVFYYIKGKEEKARAILRKLGRCADVNKELRVMIKNTNEQKAHDTLLPHQKAEDKCWTDVFTFKRNMKALAITSTLLMIQLGGGITCILYFATGIFHKAASSVDPDLATIILGVTQIFGVIVASFLVEQFGRRTLLLYSTFLCALCMGLLGGHFYVELIRPQLLESVRWMPLVLLMAFLFSFNAGLGIIPNVLVGEMFSPHVRSTGSSIAMGFGWVICFVFSLGYGYIIIVGSHFVFIICAIINAFGWIFTLKFVPETKGKSLAEIEKMMAR